MVKKLDTIRLSPGGGALKMFVWFIVFSLAPAWIFTSLAFIETQGFLLIY